MSFEITRFSEDGLDLLSQISSSKALKIKNIYCDSAYHQEADLDQDAYWWASQTSTTMAKIDATIAAISPLNNQARLIVDLALKAGQTSDVTIRTVVVTACAVESGVEGEEVVFVGSTDEDGVEVIYRSGIKISTSISLYFKFNNSSDITIDTGIDPDFVIHSELDRFVSCHSLGDVSSGDDQEILGNKTFLDNLISGSNLKINDVDETYGEVVANTDDTGVLFRCATLDMGTMFAFSDYDQENELDTNAVTITKEKAGYALTVTGSVNATALTTSYTQGNNEYSVLQLGDKLRFSLDDGNLLKSIDLGFTLNSNFGVSIENTTVLEVTPDSTIISGEAEIGGGITLDLDVSGSNVPGTVKMLYSQNTGAMMTFAVSDSLDDPNRNVSLSIYRDTIHAHKPLIAESGLQVTGWLQADAFYGNLIGTIPYPINQYDCIKGSLCFLTVSRAGGLLRGDQIVKTAAPNLWSTVGASESFGVQVASMDGSVAGVTPNLAIGDKFVILSSCGYNGICLAMRI